MMELTPLDIRKKRADFGRGLRGYDTEEVDQFLELVAERVEELVKEKRALAEQIRHLTEKVSEQESRERAVQQALVTAQALSEQVKGQARRESKLLLREARERMRDMERKVERVLQERRRELHALHRARSRLLEGFRELLDRGRDFVDAEEAGFSPDDLDVEALLASVTQRRGSAGRQGTAGKEPETPGDGEETPEG